MIRKYVWMLFFFSSIGIAVNAQTVKNTTDLNQVWLGYFNQTRFNNKWGMWTDLQLRTKEDFVSNFSQSIVRLGLTHYLTDNTKLTLGYAWINQFPGDNHPTVSRPEHRIWQQVQWHNKFPRLRLMNWIRLEERFRRKVAGNGELTSGYNFNWKVRYNFLFNVPLHKKAFAPKTLSFVFNDELHINFGKEIVYNSFDQNRLFVGLSYHINAADNIQFGYMNQYQQLASGNNYRSVDAARIFYFHNLDLRKK